MFNEFFKFIFININYFVKTFEQNSSIILYESIFDNFLMDLINTDET